MKYLIIGNGAAGVAAAERIRKLDAEGGITLLSGEPYAVYSKCLLPDYLSGDLPEERMYIRDKDFYEKKRINLYGSQEVVKIDAAQKRVYTRVGESFGYDKLLIATGSAQVIPPIPGVTSSEIQVLGTLGNAKRIIEASKKARRIVVIGAGFSGLEIAVNLYKTGKEVTIIERTPRILQEQLDETASRILQNALEEEGIRLVLGSAVAKISSSLFSNIRKWVTGDNVQSVVLEDGRKLNADMVVFAAGTKPNLGFLRDSGLDIHKGVVVNAFMQTTAEDIYAAGDVVESIDAVTGNVSLSPIWPNAVIQGEIAGSNMAGVERAFDPLISMQNASEFREIPMIAMGITSPEGEGFEVYVDERPTETIYRKVVIKDNVIVGMIFLGDIRNSGVIGALMANKRDVGKFKANLLNPNFGYSEVAYAS